MCERLSIRGRDSNDFRPCGRWLFDYGMHRVSVGFATVACRRRERPFSLLRLNRAVMRMPQA